MSVNFPTYTSVPFTHYSPVLRFTAASPVSPHHQFPYTHLCSSYSLQPCIEAYCSLSSFSSPSVSLQPLLLAIFRLIAAPYFPYQFHCSHVSRFLSIFARNSCQFAFLCYYFLISFRSYSAVSHKEQPTFKQSLNFTTSPQPLERQLQVKGFKANLMFKRAAAFHES